MFLFRPVPFLPVFSLIHYQAVNFLFSSCSQYRVLMSGCWRALFFFLGPSPRAGEGDSRHSFSGSQQYRSTLIHHTWENSLTQPLLEGMEGITVQNLFNPPFTKNNPVKLYAEMELAPFGVFASPHGEYCFSPRGVLLLTGSIASPCGEYCYSFYGGIAFPHGEYCFSPHLTHQTRYRSLYPRV